MMWQAPFDTESTDLQFEPPCGQFEISFLAESRARHAARFHEARKTLLDTFEPDCESKNPANREAESLNPLVSGTLNGLSRAKVRVQQSEGEFAMPLKDVMKRVGAGRHYLAMFAWVFLGFMYVSLISQWLTVSRRDQMFTSYTDSVIQVAANEQRPAKEVRALLLIKAEDLSLPVLGNGVQITGKGQTLRAAVHYTADISMPIVNQPVYRMRFDHDLTLR